MKKMISLLLVGVLASMFMVGCNKEAEGGTEGTTTGTTTGGDGKMEDKKGTETPPADNKMEGTTK